MPIHPTRGDSPGNLSRSRLPTRTGLPYEQGFPSWIGSRASLTLAFYPCTRKSGPTRTAISQSAQPHEPRANPIADSPEFEAFIPNSDVAARVGPVRRLSPGRRLSVLKPFVHHLRLNYRWIGLGPLRRLTSGGRRCHRIVPTEDPARLRPSSTNENSLDIVANSSRPAKESTLFSRNPWKELYRLRA